MKKDLILWSLVSMVIMLLLPWLAVTFIKGDAAMAVCFLLFFVVDPMYSISIGVLGGKNVRYLWGLPIISTILFLLGTWLFFDMGESAFILYAGIYLILGICAMLISMLIQWKKQR